MKVILKSLFNNGSFKVQCVNLGISIFWLLIYLLNGLTGLSIRLPLLLQTIDYNLVFGLSLVILFTSVGLITHHSIKQKSKVVGLLLGALTQAIIAESYIVMYPPFDLIVFACTGLSLWYIAAISYIIKYEGLTGNGANKYNGI